MRKTLFLLCALAVAGAGAQNKMADILSSIETNNPQLKAGAQMVLSQKAEVSSQNSLADPTFELEHLWGAQNAGDRKYDILGAKTVGIDSAGVLYGYGDRAELEAAGADYILPAIPDLEELLLE